MSNEQGTAAADQALRGWVGGGDDLMSVLDVSRGDRYIRDHGHHIAGWHMDSPTLGRAYAACTDCNGTIERREDGTYVGPIVEDVCPAYQRALNEQAEGIAEYYDGYGQGDD